MEHLEDRRVLDAAGLNLQGLFPGERFAVGDSLQTVAVADVNGEGVLDLITASNEDGTVSVLLDRGDGSFEERGNSLFT